MTSLHDALDIAGKTDSGMVRSHNEDAIYFEADIGLVVLADGMGGYNAGEVASGMAITIISDEVRQALLREAAHLVDFGTGDPKAHRILREAIRKANADIFQKSQTEPQCAGMGTTLVCALFYDNRLTVAHIGDSRLYRLRDSEFVQITRDHSLLQEQLDSGLITPEQAKFSQNRNLVTRALGIDESVEAELHDHEAAVGDVYLLCSDGLSDMVEDDDIGQSLKLLQGNLQLATSHLVQTANDNGGRDNISTIAIQVKNRYPVANGWFSWVLSWFGK
jgi:serine/threonine protein phosphatase PrpC